ncbi:HNH endonuclease [Martelella lutilitoris]|uniref:HNH endonuclease n=1 Tax=Martelella lutilitoris TaxID=2583532 RepID=A0A5C4JSQ0_9HYPH|nr:HNH endonuclease signature motif containing protein [Martelella lutilitoris]TNB48191.1 HNH endonuclease [Martelella lutilitoris]
MAITKKTIKILWSYSGGRCAFPGCWERLCDTLAGDAAPFPLGEMAHICGDKQGANRHNAAQTDAERDDYENLILLCPTHHRLIDRRENELTYTVDVLHEMKTEHEARVRKQLDQIPMATRPDVAKMIVPLLEENRQSWAHYGPVSELAQTQPHNEAVYAVWVSERLSVIVPNNRKIASMLEANRRLFDAEDQAAITAFLMHVRSYEQWVEDDIPYAAVKRFPKEFDDLIRGIVDGGA